MRLGFGPRNFDENLLFVESVHRTVVPIALVDNSYDDHQNSLQCLEVTLTFGLIEYQNNYHLEMRVE